MKTVVITGANHGLGLALTRQFLTAGWRVCAIARTAPEIPANANLRIEVADLTDMVAMDGVIQRLKGIAVDVLINNAGLYDSVSADDPAVDKNFTELSAMFQVNSIVPRLLADALTPHLQAGEDKLVVTMSSGMGTYAELDDYHAAHWAYGASKAAVNYAMISFATLHPDIKSVLMNPGWMQTKMGGQDAPLTPEESAASIADLITNHAKKLPNAKMVDYEGKGMEL